MQPLSQLWPSDHIVDKNGINYYHYSVYWWERSVAAIRNIDIYLHVRLMGPSTDRVDSLERCSVTLCAVTASFKPRDIYSHDSSLGEIQPAKENEANRFLRVGKVNVNWIYQVIFQGCHAVRACKTILYLKILWEFVLKGRFLISARD